MKKIKILAITMLMILTFTAAAQAEEGYFGLYNVTDSSQTDSVTISPVNWVGITPATAAKKVGTATAADFYTYAHKVNVSYSNAVSGSMYMIYVIEGSGTTPTSDNLVYVNGETAESNTIDFTIYQSRFENGKTYSIYISSNASSGIQSFTKVGSYQYYTDGNISESQARASQIRAYINKKAGVNGTPEAYDLNGDGYINETDVEIAREA